MSKYKSAVIICPADETVLHLNSEEGRYTCSKCGRFYQARNGVINFLDSRNNFYEGAYKNQVKFIPRSEKWYHIIPLWLINNGYLWQVRKYISEGSTVVELGCAGGIKYFGKRFFMTGIDLSESSLKLIGDDYILKIVADVSEKIPLPDNSADAFVSSFFWEHIPSDYKKKILNECRRVLSVKGKLLFLFDVETENPVIKLLKKQDSGLYRKEFIENDGHFGYQTPAENRKLFEEAGFTIIKYFGFERTPLQSVPVYEKMRRWSGVYKYLGNIGNLLSRNPFLFPYIFILRTVDHSLGKFFPIKYSRIVLAICEKA